jgi:hypothetical protein
MKRGQSIGMWTLIVVAVGLSVIDFDPEKPSPTLSIPAKRSTYPVGAFATKDSGFIVLFLEVNGEYRPFMIDSGASVSTYDFSKWTQPKGSQSLELNISSCSLPLATIRPSDSNGSPIYNGPSIRPVALLGEDFLSQVVLMFDPRSHTALLWPSKTFDADKVLRQTPAQRQSWPFNGFHDIWPHPWTLMKTDYDEDSKIYTKMQIGGRTLESAIDTGCTSTGVVLSQLDGVDHWDYASQKGNFWSQTAAQRFFVVPKIDVFSENIPFGTVDELITGASADAWIGLDLINRGRWIMDTSHHYFGVQQYSDRAPIRVSCSNGSFLLDADGQVEWTKSYCESDTYRVTAINGQEPAEALGELSTDRSRTGLAKHVGQRLRELNAKPFDLTLVKDGIASTQHCVPFEKGNLPTVAEIVAKQGK